MGYISENYRCNRQLYIHDRRCRVRCEMHDGLFRLLIRLNIWCYNGYAWDVELAQLKKADKCL